MSCFSRQLLVTDDGDEFSKRELANKHQRTLMMIKPGCVRNAGEIIHAIAGVGDLHVVAARMAKLSLADARDFYAEHAGKPFFDGLCDYMSSDKVLALEVVGSNAISSVRELIGPTDSARARSEAPKSIRARFGTDGRHTVAPSTDRWSLVLEARL